MGDGSKLDIRRNDPENAEPGELSIEGLRSLTLEEPGYKTGPRRQLESWVWGSLPLFPESGLREACGVLNGQQCCLSCVPAFLGSRKYLCDQPTINTLDTSLSKIPSRLCVTRVITVLCWTI